MITFLQDVELEVVESFDEETEEKVSKIEKFCANEEFDADVFNDHGDFIDIQFSDGSVIYNIRKSIVKYDVEA